CGFGVAGRIRIARSAPASEQHPRGGKGEQEDPGSDNVDMPRGSIAGADAGAGAGHGRPSSEPGTEESPAVRDTSGSAPVVGGRPRPIPESRMHRLSPSEPV